MEKRTTGGETARGCLRAVAGLALAVVVHLPRLLYLTLQLSYAAVFNNVRTLTADPAEHLRRAREFLSRKNDLSVLLYAALELRFAVERMAQREVIFSEMISQRFLDETDPVKKLKAQRRADPESAYPHKIIFVNQKTGERVVLGQYKPMDPKRIAEIKGKLGNLLHPQDGIPLGVPSDPWYQDTKAFLRDAEGYLSAVLKDNKPYFAYANLDHMELVKVVE